MGTLHKYVTKKLSKKEYAIFLNELEKGNYNFDKEDLAEDGSDNSLHMAFKNTSQNSKLVDAFITGSIKNPKTYSTILKHYGEKGLTPVSSLIINNNLYAKILLRKLLKNSDIFLALSICRNGHKNILHHVIEHGSPSIINEYLIELFNKDNDTLRCNIINHKDKIGNTPLHIAAKKGKHLIARTLLRLGADYNIENNAQKTPVRIADENKHAITANIIYRYGHTNGNAPPTLPKNKTFMNKVSKNKNKKLKN